MTSGRWETVEIWLGLLSDDDPGTHLAQMKAGISPQFQRRTSPKSCAGQSGTSSRVQNNTNRTDDPGGDGFDKFTTLKFSNNVRTRSQTLHSIYDLVRQWAADKNDFSDKEVKLLNEWFIAMRPHKSSPIAMFEPLAWTIVTDGKYDSFGNASRHPTWKKA